MLTSSNMLQRMKLLLSPVCGVAVVLSFFELLFFALLLAFGFLVSDSLAIKVELFDISFVAFSSEKYLLQSLQYQYSMFPSASFVAAFALTCSRAS